MDLLNVAIADDEPLARKRLASVLTGLGCDVVAEFAEGNSLLEWFATGQKLDILFMDIHMPGLSGLELLAEIIDPPAVVFVTAHPDFALMAFELSAVDYILKPVFPERVARTVEKIRRSRMASGPADPGPKAADPSRYIAKTGDGKVFLDMKRTTHFELSHDVVWAWYGGKRYRTQWETLGQVEAAFPHSGLMRIQRNTLLRPEAVTGFQSLQAGRIKVRVWEGVELEVSRSCTPCLKKQLGLA